MTLLRLSRFGSPTLVLLAAAITACGDQTMPTQPDAARDAGPTVSRAMGDGLEVPAVMVGAGDIARCDGTGDTQTANLVLGIPGTVFTLGDNTPNGTAAEFTDCYGPTWGQFKDRTRPVSGNKDYFTPGATPYYDYFGTAAGETGKGFYSYDVGEWHVVALNSDIAMSVGSEQEVWLRQDLAATTRSCTLAYWHYPRFYSYSSGLRGNVLPLWNALYEYGAELVLNADVRFYERFAPQTPAGVLDADYGIRQFIVGTGGYGSYTIGTVRPNSEVRNSGTHGVIKLDLYSDGYEWEFIPVAGKTFTDAGSGTCHPPSPPVAQPGGPYAAEAAVVFDGSESFDPQGNTPLTYAWDFGDGAAGAGVAPTHEYATEGSYTVSLVVTDALGNASAPATTTVTIANVAPVVSAGPDLFTSIGETVTMRASVSDAGGEADSPWAYTVDWGDGASDAGTLLSLAGPIQVSHAYAAPGTFVARVTVTDADGGSSFDDVTMSVSAEPLDQVFVGAGNIAKCTVLRDEATATLVESALSGQPGAAFTAGDNAFPDGTLRDYEDCYEPSWGRFKSRTYPTLGNHEYRTGSAQAAFDYYGSVLGASGYYSYDLGAWHIVVLNDNSPYVPYKANSAQDVWLRADLAANTKPCTLAIWHTPLFLSSSTTGFISNPARKILWDRLYAAGADVVINGQQHHYERFRPMRPDGSVDDATGIREFIVGTGGESMAAMPTVVAPNSEVRGVSFGVLKLTLRSAGYDWEFLPVPGATFTDTGTGTCH
jgi:PKD repeat protein